MADIHQQSAVLKPEQILEIIIRRRWLILIPLCIFLTIGLWYALTAPKIYEASTTILIQPQKVPTGYVQSIVSTDNQQRINTISKLILSRTNLEKIINDFRLYQDAEGMYLEDKILDLRKKITVQQNSRDSRGTEAFSISFNYKDNPELVMNVANKLASFFMDENLKARESQAIGTSQFLESELEKIKIKLEGREKILAEYRAKYMGGLPDELDTNLRTLDRLQLQHTDALNTLRETQNNANLLKSQISRLKEMSQSGAATLRPDGTFVGTSNLSVAEQQYELEKRQLDGLLLKYTTKHPEVIKLTRSIAKLEERVKEEKKGVDSSGGDMVTTPGPEDTPPAVSSNDNALFQYESNLKHLENEIADLKVSIQKITKSMEYYQKKVEDTPKREQELRSIQRDYSNISISYNSLLARRLEAELAVNMEKKQKGEQFHIIDHARTPERPISPDVKKILVIFLAMGLGGGGGIIFLLEFFNPVIRSEEQIETEIGLPILASITSLAKMGVRWKKWFGGIAYAVFALYTGVVLLFFIILNLKGIDKTLSLVKTYLNL